MSSPYLIVGLGNPGQQYEKTRHNVGFMVIEQLAHQWGIAGKPEKKFEAMMGKGVVSLPNGESVTALLAQPTTFMNLSGKSVAAVLQFYKIPQKNLIVVVDDIALPLGKLRYRANGSDGGHNGLKSIAQCLGNSKDYARLRLGVGAPISSAQQVAHVLGKFPKAEEAVLTKVLDASCEAITAWLTDDANAVMTRFNGLDLADASTQ